MLILNEVLIPCIIIILIILGAFTNMSFLLNSLLRGIIIFLLLLAIKLIGDKAFKTESLGWGDVNLSFVAGLVLGFKLGLVYLFLGALIALPFGIYLRKSKKDLLMPFGPFLITSMWIIYAFSPVFNNLMNILLGV
jgi:prepilin signal peptidase PulO-like enzyme (type II secretory pathway)